MAIEPDRARHHDADAGKTPSRKAEEASRDSFPASDAPAPTGLGGARAVPASEMLAESPMPQSGDSATVTARFKDRETAKLAIEQVVREGPIDRRCTELRPGDDTVTVEVRAPRADAERICTLPRQAGGEG
jgi:hypothetical protein